MEAKKILIVSTDQIWLRDLKSNLSKTPRVIAEFCTYPPDAKKSMQDHMFDCFIIEDSVAAKDIEEFIETIMESEVHKKVPLILSTKDFDMFKEIIGRYPRINIRIIEKPAPIDEIEKSLFAILFPRSKENIEQDEKLYPVDLDLLRVFIESIHKGLNEMTMRDDYTFGKPFLLKKTSEFGEIGISARVLVESEVYNGAFYLIFPTQTYFKLYESIMGEHPVEFDLENKDLAGEFVNIVYGLAKKRLNDNGYKLNMAIPETVFGVDNRIVNLLVVAVPFQSYFGDFYAKFVPNMN